MEGVSIREGVGGVKGRRGLEELGGRRQKKYREREYRMGGAERRGGERK